MALRDHKPTSLSPVERSDLGSIAKHPGMDVVRKILRSHFEQELMSVLDVELDAPNRTQVIEAIATSASSMQKFLDLFEREVELNYETLLQQE